jgi:dipeptidyl aminopeptidase/acylaminoacyl peptidase
MRVLLTAGALLAFCLPAASGEERGPGRKAWTAAALMSLKTVHDPQITSDGARVAYVVRAVDAARNRYVSSILVSKAAGGPATPLAGAHPSDSSPRWSPDGRRLAFLSRRDGTAQVFVAADLAKPPRRVTQSATDVEFFRWSPDGREIGYLAAEPPTDEQAERAASGDDAIVAGEGIRNSHLYAAALDGGRSRALVSGKHLLSFDWSPDGKRVAYAAQQSSRPKYRYHADIFETDLASGVETPVVVQPGQDLAPSYSPDGRSIAFYSQRGTLSFFGDRQVGIVPSGGGSIRYVTGELDGDIFNGAKKFSWQGGKLFFGAGKGTGDYLFSVDLKTGAPERLPYQLSDTAAFSFSGDGSRMAWIKASAELPPDVYVSDVRITDLNPQVGEYEKVRAQTVRWKSRDGIEIEGVLRLPFNLTERTRVPLIVGIHGGPTGVAQESFPIPRTYPTQLFLQQGFAVFEPNFRGSINYGPKFRTPLIQALGRVDMDDVLTGVEMLVEKGIADPNRLGVMGWSYGGYLSSWIVGHDTRFRAASIGACSMDWVSAYGSSVGRLDGPPEVIREYFGGEPWLRFADYDRHSPRFFIKNIKTPSLLLRGERDDDSIAELHLALSELHVPNTFVTYPREPHSIGEPAHQRDLLERNLAWFRKWLDRRAE